VKLASFTTLGLGGPADKFVTAASDDELIEAVTAAADGPLLVLGGGSNLVIADEGFPGTVVHVATRGIAIDGVLVTAAAGEPWDGVVARTVEAGLSGLECLSGIPGLAGATPIQNVGAYGQEVADTITAVRAYDRDEQQTLFFNNKECCFSYRHSVFRDTDRYVVLEVTFRLSRDAAPIRYAELAKTVLAKTVLAKTVLAKTGGAAAAPPGDVRAAVLGLRRGKGMVLDPADPDTRSAGSFFTNPVVAAAPEGAPHFDAGDGKVKVPAAWLIEHAGFAKGYPGPDAPVRISAKHTLALVNSGTGTTSDLLALAREIRAGVDDAFGIELRPEPTLIGASL
jgi:UDP-N-acetylmuramate dehydrogenase